jgi:glycosyltransferase involved in cell wall biosynthesis
MAEKERLKIGILFNFDPIWMGGIIYIQNLIRILNFLDDDEKPEIILFYRPDLKKYIDIIQYPFLQSIEWSFPSTVKGNLLSWMLGENIFVSDILKQHNDLNGLFPVQDHPVETKSKTKLVCWYADLQHKYYPEFFTKRKVFERNFRIKMVLNNSDELVVSSQAVANDFYKFFKIKKDYKFNIFPFASIVDDLCDLNIIEVRKKFNLPVNYYMISNQFAKHKNHEVLLRSLIKLKAKGSDIHFAMTGPFLDAPPTTYRQKLKSIIEENNLQSSISLLGLLSRKEQLLLMKHAQAVIQPSLFEGWSTVIEDAISLQVPVIASSLPVNIEQLGEKGTFFDPHDHNKLAEIISSFPDRNVMDVLYEPYNVRVRKAAKIFVEIFRTF